MTEVAALLDSVEHPVRRRDAHTLVDLMRRVTGEEPKLWSGSIVGFGDYHYRYATGREGDTMRVGFSPRKPATTLYLSTLPLDEVGDELGRLGPHTTGVSCLYLKDLEKVDLDVLEVILRKAYDAEP